jgi:hypothetical protein
LWEIREKQNHQCHESKRGTTRKVKGEGKRGKKEWGEDRVIEG